MNSFSPMLGLHYICPTNSSKTNNMKRSLFLVTLLLSIVLPAFADDFSYQDGRASLSPYPTDRIAREFPDSLTPIFVNHVGRHGSRYPAGSLHTMMMKHALDKANSLNTITPLGKQLLEEVDAVIETTAGRWGALDSIGESEHRNIAERLFRSCPELLDSARVVAISSYSPRSIKSMYAFLHRLTELSSNIDATAASGRRFNPLMRNFDEDEAYKSFRTDTAYLATYNRFLSGNITIDPLLRVLGENYPLDYDTTADLALAEYYVSAGMNAMGLTSDASRYFTIEEYHNLWSIFNFRQYLLYSASTLSSRPAEIAAPLLQDIVMTADSVLTGKLHIAAKFRFGHAETLMPLLSLMQLPGCHYLTNYFDTVADEWKDFASFPMAANLQLVYFKAPSGRIYVRGDLNERPVNLIPGKPIYVEWNDLRSYWLGLLPLE